jgi:hypothetical protein
VKSTLIVQREVCFPEIKMTRPSESNKRCAQLLHYLYKRGHALYESSMWLVSSLRSEVELTRLVKYSAKRKVIEKHLTDGIPVRQAACTSFTVSALPVLFSLLTLDGPKKLVNGGCLPILLSTTGQTSR